MPGEKIDGTDSSDYVSKFKTMVLRRFFFIAILLTSCEDKLNWIKDEVPVVYSIDPDTGESGTIVTISGSNFDIIPSKNTVTIHGTGAIITEASPTTLKFIAPEETTGPVVVAHLRR